MNPDSSKNTSVAPRFRAFFLDAGIPSCAIPRSLLRRARVHVFRVFGTSTQAGVPRSSARGPRGTRPRTGGVSVPLRADTSRDRWTSHGLGPPEREAPRVSGAASASGDGDVQGEALPKAPGPLWRPWSPRGSPNSDCIPASRQSGSACSLAPAARERGVFVSPVLLHFLEVSYRVVYMAIAEVSIKKAGVNK